MVYSSKPEIPSKASKTSFNARGTKAQPPKTSVDYSDANRRHSSCIQEVSKALQPWARHPQTPKSVNAESKNKEGTLNAQF